MILGDEVGALGDRDEGADVVEQVDEEEYEDDFKRAMTERAVDIKVEGRRRDGGEVIRLRLPMNLVKDEPKRHGA